jgi:hypothetical protein
LFFDIKRKVVNKIRGPIKYAKEHLPAKNDQNKKQKSVAEVAT